MTSTKSVALGAIAWVITVILMWFLVSFLACIASDLTYKEALGHRNQILAIIFIYWWMPSLFVGIAVQEYYDK